MKAVASLALVLLFYAGAAWLFDLAHERIPDGAQRQVEFLPSDGPALPAPGAQDWQRVSLPHVWSDTPALRAQEYGWYRLRFGLDPADTVRGAAIVLWQLSMNARVYLDGVLLGDGGRMRDPVARNEFRPLLFKLPPPIATAGEHELLILLRGVPAGRGFLGPILTGPGEELEAAYRERFRLKASFLHFGAILIAAIVIPMGLLGLWRPHDTVYAWFAWFGVMFVANTVLFTSRDLLLPAPLWEWSFAVTINLALVAVLIFVHRFLEVSRPRLERALLWASGAGALLLAGVAVVAPDKLHYWTRGFWCTASVAMAVYPGFMIFQAYWRRPQESGFFLMLSGTLMLVFGIRDLLAINHWWVTPVQGFWTHYVVPVSVLVFSSILLRRFHLSMQESETLNRELEDRVLQKQQEIEAKHEELREVARQRVLAHERERILRDMHDGLGGTLISTLARLESDGASESPAARSIREALVDLRLLLYSLEPSADSLRSSLAMLRDRLSAQCEDLGLRLVWDAKLLPDELQLERRSTLQLMRLIQEGFTNTLKHAQASEFCIRLAIDPDDAGTLQVSVSDNGRGFDIGSVSGQGVGLRSMQGRAVSLGGELDIRSDTQGTRLALRIGLPA